MNRARFAIAGSLVCAILAASSCDEGLPTSPAQFSATLQPSGGWPDTLDAGERRTFHSSVQVNNLTVEGAVVQWSVSAPRILFVDTTTSTDSASVRGLRPGTATVTVRLNDEALTTQTIKHDVTVRLRGVRVAGPMTDTTLTAFADTVLVRAAGLTLSGEDADSAGVTFTATGGALESVDQRADSLWLTSVANGTSRVIVSQSLCAGKCADTVLVAVQQAPADVTAPDTVHVRRLQDPRTLEASVRDHNGFIVADSAPRWDLVSGDGVVSLDADGTLTGLANGTARAAASLQGAADTSVVVVRQVVADAALSDSLIAFGAVALEDTVTLTLADSSGIAVQRPVTISWSSSDTDAVTVAPLANDSTQAVVRSVAVGEAYVRATAEGQRDSVLVRVTQTPASIDVLPAADTLNALGDTTELAATARDENGQAIPGAVITWASLDTLVATVDAAGEVVGQGTGTAAITATAGDVADTVDILVRQIPATVVVTGGVDSLAAGDTTTFVAAVADSNANPVTAPALTWTSSDTTVAVVDGGGLVTGASTGTATITASAAPASGSRDITVTNLVIDSVDVAPDSIHFDALNDTMHATARALNPQGNVIPGVAITWSSSDNAVATVDADGVVTSVADGTAEITADADGATATVPVVVAQEVADVKVTPANRSLTSLTETAQLSASVTDAAGTAVAGAGVAWSSADTLIATVSGSGLVTAVGNGVTSVFAVSGSEADSAKITVAQTVDSVNVSPDAGTLDAVGDTIHLAAAVTDALGQAVTDPGTTWTSRTTAAATVDGTGVVTAVANGSSWVVAEAGGVRDSALITVAQAVASISTTPASATLTSLGETLQLDASILDSNGNPVGGASATWTSTDDAVATVNDGLVEAVANGSAKIVAALDGKADTTAITVNQTVMTVTVAPSTAALTSKVDSVQLTASATDSLGNNVAGAAFTWATASGSGVVTVSTSGLVVSTTTGTDTVVVTSGSASASATITVTQLVASLTVSPSADTIPVRGTTVLTVTAKDANNYTVSDPALTWISRTTDTTTVVAGAGSATVTGVDGGHGVITVASGSAEDTANILVKEYALDFDGTDDYASISTNPVRLDSLPTWTVELWVRPDAASGDEYLFAKEAPDNDGNLSYAILLRDGVPLLIYRTGGGPGSEYELVGSTALSTGTWHHLAFTYDASSGATLYVDGSADGSASSSGSAGSGKSKGNNTILGAYGSGGGFFDGGLDEIRVWSVVRDASQIATNRALRVATDAPDLIGYWGLDAGASDPSDLTGNHGNGTLGGGTASKKPAWSTDVPEIH